jgi:hypothetical protein
MVWRLWYINLKYRRFLLRTDQAICVLEYFHLFSAVIICMLWQYLYRQ